MIAEDISRAKREERIDKLAASYILQGAIDALVSAHAAVDEDAEGRNSQA